MDELNGRPVPGTSVQHTRPDCSGGGGGGSGGGGGGVQRREWKKCPGRKRKEFQDKLMDKLTREMIRATRDKDIGHLFIDDDDDDEEDERVSLEERVAKWKFAAMDRNKNGVRNSKLSTEVSMRDPQNLFPLYFAQRISRREIRPFRRWLKKDRDLRLCGKRIQLHCDSDDDENITREEWEVCIGVREGEKSHLRQKCKSAQFLNMNSLQNLRLSLFQRSAEEGLLPSGGGGGPTH